ncbi:MAG: hypothetical protein LBR30_02480 [Clostridioides sp.]|nr:hypothetical protein [Clostridioides sp.]
MGIYLSDFFKNVLIKLNENTLEYEKTLYLDKNIFPNSIFPDEVNGFILIPNKPDGLLYKVDNLTGKVVQTVEIGGAPNNIIKSGKHFFISSLDSNSVYVLEEEYLIPSHLITIGEKPSAIDYFDKNKELYVACEHSVYVIDTCSKEVKRKVEFDAIFWELKINKKKEEMYLSTFDSKIRVIDMNNFEIKKEIEGFGFVNEILVDEDKNIVYISDLIEEKIVIFNYEKFDVLKKISLGFSPEKIFITKNGLHLIVKNSYENCIKIINTDEFCLEKEIHL